MTRPSDLKPSMQTFGWFKVTLFWVLWTGIVCSDGCPEQVAVEHLTRSSRWIESSRTLSHRAEGANDISAPLPWLLSHIRAVRANIRSPFPALPSTSTYTSADGRLHNCESTFDFAWSSPTHLHRSLVHLPLIHTNLEQHQNYTRQRPSSLVGWPCRAERTRQEPSLVIGALRVFMCGDAQPPPDKCVLPLFTH